MLPLDGHEVAVVLQHVCNLLGDAVTQPDLVQLLEAFLRQVQRVAASAQHKKCHTIRL
jgi:hypothetical protein